jgi:hypothetical protein
MSSLVSDAEKVVIEDALHDAWETFKRPFLVYRDAEKILVATTPSYTYSRFGPTDQNVTEPVNVPQAVTIYGTILYEKKQYWEFFSPGSTGNIKVKVAQGKVRVTVDEAGYQIFKDARQITIDGFEFRLNTTPRPHGLFAPKRYTFFLERIE